MFFTPVHVEKSKKCLFQYFWVRGDDGSMWGEGDGYDWWKGPCKFQVEHIIVWGINKKIIIIKIINN